MTTINLLLTDTKYFKVPAPCAPNGDFELIETTDGVIAVRFLTAVIVNDETLFLVSDPNGGPMFLIRPEDNLAKSVSSFELGDILEVFGRKKTSQKPQRYGLNWHEPVPRKAVRESRIPEQYFNPRSADLYYATMLGR